MAEQNPLDFDEIARENDLLRRSLGMQTIAEDKNREAVLANAGAFDGSTQKLKTASERIQAAGQDLARAAASSVATISKGSTTLGSMNESVKNLMSSLDRIASGVPVVGKSLSVAVGAATKAMMLLPEAGDQTLKTLRDLSSVGGVSADGIEAMRKQANHLLISYDQLSAIVQENATGFALYGKTVSEGEEAFAKVQTQLANTDDELRNLGYSTDSMAKAAASYVTQQGKLSLNQRLTQEQLTKGTQDYLRELDAVARLTGKSREELDKANQRRQLEAAVVARQLTLGSTAGKSDEQIATDQQQIARETEVSSALTAKFGEEVGKGFDAMIAGVGNAPEYLKFASTVKGGREAVEQFKKGEINESQVYDLIIRGVKEGLKNQSEAELRGQAASEVGGYSPYFSLATRRDMAIAQEGGLQAAREERDKAKEGEGGTADLTGAEKKLQQANANFQDAITDALPLFSKGLKTAASGLEEMTSGLKNLTGQIREILGGVNVAGEEKSTLQKVKESLPGYDPNFDKAGQVAGAVANAVKSAAILSDPILDKIEDSVVGAAKSVWNWFSSETGTNQAPKTIAPEVAEPTTDEQASTESMTESAPPTTTVVAAQGRFGQTMSAEEFERARISKTEGGEAVRADIAARDAAVAAPGQLAMPITEEQLANPRVSTIKGGDRARAEITAAVSQQPIPQTIVAAAEPKEQQSAATKAAINSQAVTTAVEEQRDRVSTGRYEDDSLALFGSMDKELAAILNTLRLIYEWAYDFGEDIETAFDVKERIEAKRNAEQGLVGGIIDGIKNMLGLGPETVSGGASGAGGGFFGGGGAGGGGSGYISRGEGAGGRPEVGDAKGLSGNAATKQAMDYFVSQGWTKEQAAGIVGNLQQESGNFSQSVVSGQRRGDGGKAVGIAQWHPDRQANFKKVFGKDLAGSSLEEQLAFVNYELKQGSEKKAGNILSTATTAEDAAALMDKHYERSRGTERGVRMANARNLMKIPSDKPAVMAEAPAGPQTVAQPTTENVAKTDEAALTQPQTVASKEAKPFDFKEAAKEAIQEKQQAQTQLNPMSAASPQYPGVTSVSSTGFGGAGLTTPTTQNLVAPESAPAKLDTASLTPQKPDAAASPAAPTQGSDNEVLAGLMSEQLSQLTNLNGLMKKQNATTEQILKSQK